MLDIEKDTEQTGKTNKRKGLYSSTNDLNTRRRGLRVGPTDLTGEQIDLQMVTGDSNVGKSYSFKLKRTAFL